MARGKLTSVVLGVMLVFSVALNLRSLFFSIDSGVSLDHMEVSFKQALKERDIVIAACNAALNGSHQADILASVKTAGATILEEPSSSEGKLEVFANEVRLNFVAESLVKLSTPFDDPTPE